MSKENLVVRIEPELLDRIDTQCAELDVSRSLLIREILFLMFAPADEIRKRIENRNAIQHWITNQSNIRRES